MAQATRERPEQPSPGQAIDQADRVMQELSSIPTRRPGVGAEMAGAIEAAERDAQSAARVAGEIDRIFGLSDAQQQAREMRTLGTRLESLETGLGNLVEQYTEGDETRWRARGGRELGGAEATIGRMLEVVQRARREFEQGNRENAQRAISSIMPGLQQVDNVIGTVGRLRSIGAHQDIINAVGNSLMFFGAVDRESRQRLDQRGQTILQFAELYLEKANVFQSQSGRELEADFRRDISTLADPTIRINLSDARTALQTYRTRAETIETEWRTDAHQAFRVEMHSLQEMLTQGVILTREMRQQVERQLGELRALNERLADETTRGQVTEDELQRAAFQTASIRAVYEQTRGITSPTIRNQAQNTFCAALDVFRATGDERMYGVMMMAVGQIRTHTSRRDAQLRRSLVSDAQAVAAAETPQAREQAMDAIVQRLSGSMSAEIRSTARGLGDEETTRRVETIATALGQLNGASATPEHFMRARAAQDILTNMRQHSRATMPEEQRPTVIAIYNRSLAALEGGNVRAAAAQSFLAEQYAGARTDERRQELAGLSSRLEANPRELQLVEQYMNASQTIETYRQELGRGRFRAGPAREAMEGLISELETMRARMVSGNLATAEQIAQVQQAITARMESEPAFRQQLEAQARENNMSVEDFVSGLAAMQANRVQGQRLDALIQTGQSFVTAIKARDANAANIQHLGQLFGFAVEALRAGNMQDGRMYLDAGRTYSGLRGRDRTDLMAVMRGYHDQGIPRERVVRMHQVYQAMAQHVYRVPSGSVRANAQAYFDLALIAARGQNVQEFETVLELATLYSTLAPVPSSELTEEDRERRDQAIEFVRENLGDYRRDRQILGGRRFVDVGSGSRRAWTPSGVTAELAQDIIADARGEASERDADARATRVGQIRPNLDQHMSRLDGMLFERRAQGILGRGASTESRREGVYSREERRLNSLADRMESRGSTELAEYYRAEASRVSRQFVLDTVEAARTAHRQGVEERNAGLRLEAEASQLQTAIGNLHQAADLGALARSVVRRERGAQATLDALPAEVRAQVERLTGNEDFQRAARGTDAQFTAYMRTAGRARRTDDGVRRGLVADAAHSIGMLVVSRRREAQAHGLRSRSLIHSAEGMLDGIEQYDTSVRMINTRHREAGRFQLDISVRTLRGVALGQDVDMLGQPVTGTDGQPVQLTAEREQQLMQQAGLLLRAGRMQIEQQRGIMRARSAGIASARRTLVEGGAQTAAANIQRLINLVPEADRATYRSRLETAVAMTGRGQERDRARALQGVYTDLVSATGVRHQDSRGQGYYNPEQSYHDFRRASGLYWAEQFSAASQLVRRSSFDMRLGSMRLGNWITYEERHRAHLAARGISDGRSTGFLLIDPLAPALGPGNASVNWHLAAELIAHLPPDQRASYERRLERIRPDQVTPGTPQYDEVFNILWEFEEGQHRVGGTSGPFGTGRNIYQVVMTGELMYYNAEEFDRDLANAARQADDNLGAAETSLLGIQDGMSRAAEVQSIDDRRLAARHRAWQTLGRREALASTYLERGPAIDLGDETARPRGEREDRNELLTSAVLPRLRASMTRDIDEAHREGLAHIRARDAILAGGQVVRMDAGTVGTLVQYLSGNQRYYELSNGQTIHEMEQAMIAAQTSSADPNAGNQIAAELYTMIAREYPVILVGAVRALEGERVYSAFTDGELAQLNALAMHSYAGDRHQQRAGGWQAADTLIRRGQSDLQLADQADAYRRERNADMMAMEERSGWSPHRYTSGSHRAHAASAFEMASAILNERNDFRFRDMVENGERFILSPFQYTGSTPREWHYGGGGLYVARSSNPQARSTDFVTELARINYLRDREFVAYTEAGDYHLALDTYSEMSRQQTVLDLAQLGYRITLSGDENYSLERWNPTAEQQDLLGRAMRQHALLRGNIQETMMGHDSSWGTDPQNSFLRRMGERFAFNFEAAQIVMDADLQPRTAMPRTAVVRFEDRMDMSYEFVERGGRLEDSDPLTRGARESMGNYAAASRVLTGVGEFVVATAGVVAAPFTGGGSLAVTMAIGAKHMADGFEMRRQAGEWTGMATFTTVMGGVEMVLPFAGEIAGAASGGARLTSEAIGMGVQVSRGQRIFAAVFAPGRAALAEGATEAVQLTRMQRLGAMALGTSEMSLAQRGVHIAGGMMMGAGVVHFGTQAGDMYEQVLSGQMRWWEAGFYTFQTIMSPVQMGLAARRAAVSYERPGAPMYRSRFRQTVEAITLGMPFDTRAQHATALAYSRANRAYQSMPEPVRATYDRHVRRSGVEMPLEQRARYLQEFADGVSQGRYSDFEQFAAGNRQYQIDMNEIVYAAVREGQQIPLTPDQQVYVRARIRGTPEDAMAAVVTARAARPAAPATPPPTPVAPAARRGATPPPLPAAARGRAGAMRARSEAAAAAQVQQQEVARYRTIYEPHATGRAVSGDGTTTYTMGHGDARIQYSEIHFRAGVELIRHAETLRAAHPDFHTYSPQRRAAAVQETLGSVPEGMRGRAAELAQDRRFIAASGQTPNRGQQLNIALDHAGYIPQIANMPQVMRSAYRGEAVRLVEANVYRPNELRAYAQDRLAQAEASPNAARRRALTESAEYLQAAARRLEGTEMRSMVRDLSGHMSVGGEGTARRYTIGSGDDQISYTGAHVQAAGELVYHADVAVRQAVADHPDFNTMSLARREQILAQQMGHVRPEMRASAIELAARPEFIRATTAETPNRRMQMELGIERAGYLPAISFDTPVMRATYATEVQSIIRDPSLDAAALGSFARRRAVQAGRYREQAATATLEARTATSDMTRQALTRRAERLNAIADAIEYSNGFITREAARRAPAARAERAPARARPAPAEARPAAAEPARVPPEVEMHLQGANDFARQVAGELHGHTSREGTVPAEYADAVGRIRAAQPEERGMVIADEARRISYQRDERALNAELEARGITGQAAEDARNILRGMHGRIELTPATEIYLNPRVAQAVMDRMNGAGSLIDACIHAAPMVRAPQPEAAPARARARAVPTREMQQTVVNILDRLEAGALNFQRFPAGHPQEGQLTPAGVDARRRVGRQILSNIRDLRAGRINLGQFWERIGGMASRGGRTFERQFPSLRTIEGSEVSIQDRAYLEMMVDISREVARVMPPRETLARVQGSPTIEFGVVSFDLVRQNFLNDSSGVSPGEGVTRRLGDLNIRDYIGFLREMPGRVNARLEAMGIDAQVYSAAFGTSSDEGGLLIVARTPGARRRAMQLISREVARFNVFENSPLGRMAAEVPASAPYMRRLFGRGRLRAGVAFERVSVADAQAVDSHTLVGRLYRAADADPRVVRRGQIIRPARPGTGAAEAAADIQVIRTPSDTVRIEGMMRQVRGGVDADGQPIRVTVPEAEGRRAEVRDQVVQDRVERVFGTRDAQGLDQPIARVQQEDEVMLVGGAIRFGEDAAGQALHQRYRQLGRAEGKMYGMLEQGQLGLSSANLASHVAGDQLVYAHLDAVTHARQEYARAHGLRLEQVQVMQTGNGPEFVVHIRGARASRHTATLHNDSGTGFLDLYRARLNQTLGEGLVGTARGMRVPPEHITRSALAEGMNYLKDGLELGLVPTGHTGPEVGTFDYNRDVLGGATARGGLSLQEHIRMAGKAGSFMSEYFASSEIRAADSWLGQRLESAFGDRATLQRFISHLESNGIRLRSFTDVSEAISRWDGIPQARRQRIVGSLRDPTFLRAVDARYTDVSADAAAREVRGEAPPRPRPPSGGGPRGGRRPDRARVIDFPGAAQPVAARASSGGPRAAATPGEADAVAPVADLAARRRQAADAHARQQLAQEISTMRGQVNTGDDVAAFARRVVQRDPEALQTFRRMREIDGASFREVRRFVADPEFRRAARRPPEGTGDQLAPRRQEQEFRRYVQDHQAVLDSASDRVHGRAPPQAEAARATGTTGAAPVDVVGTAVEVHPAAGSAPGAMRTMAVLGNRSVPDGAVTTLVRDYRAAGAGAVDHTTRRGMDITRMRYLVEQRGLTIDQAARTALMERPPASVSELSPRARQLHDVSEALLSGDDARIRAAQDAFRQMTPADQETVSYMIAEGSEFRSAVNPEDRLLVSEMLGNDITAEAAGRARDTVSQERLTELARHAEDLVYGGAEGRVRTSTYLRDNAILFNPAEARAFGRFYQMMSAARRRLPVADYVAGYMANRGAAAGPRPVPDSFSSRADFDAYVASVESTMTRGQYVDEVVNSRQVIPVPDVHGDAHGLVDQLVRTGVLTDTRPDLPAGDTSLALHQRYRLNPNLPQGSDVVFMGDYVDRGPTSMEVIDVVRQMQRDAATRGIRVHSLRGNHEALFMRFYELFRGMSLADVQSASAGVPSGGQPPRFDFRGSFSATARQQYANAGIDLSRASIADLGFDAARVGIPQTLDSILNRYRDAYTSRMQSDPAFRAQVDAGQMDLWRYSVQQMESDGTMSFLRGTRGAVIIDNNLFTHGGPHMGARTHTVDAQGRRVPILNDDGTPISRQQALDRALAPIMGDVHSHWAMTDFTTTTPGGSYALDVLGRAVRGGDHSMMYASMGDWVQRLQVTEPDGTASGRSPWMREMDFDHVYVGHDRGSDVNQLSPYATNLDVGMSSAYGAGHGLLVIDPTNPTAPIRHVSGRGATTDRRGRPVAERPHVERDFSAGRSRRMVLRNDISLAAERFYGPGVVQPPETVLQVQTADLTSRGARPVLEANGSIRALEAGGHRYHQFVVDVGGAEITVCVSDTHTGQRLLAEFDSVRMQRTPGQAHTPAEWEGSAGRMRTSPALEAAFVQRATIIEADGQPRFNQQRYDGQQPLRRVARSLDVIARSSLPEAEIPVAYRNGVERIRQMSRQPGITEAARAQTVLDAAGDIIADRTMAASPRPAPPAPAADQQAPRARPPPPPARAAAPSAVQQTVTRYENYMQAQQAGGATIHYPEVTRMRQLIASRQLPAEPGARRQYLERVARVAIEDVNAANIIAQELQPSAAPGARRPVILHSPEANRASIIYATEVQAGRPITHYDAAMRAVGEMRNAGLPVPGTPEYQAAQTARVRAATAPRTSAVPASTLEQSVGTVRGRDSLESILPRRTDAAAARIDAEVRRVARVLDNVRGVDRSRLPTEYHSSHAELQGVDAAHLDAVVLEQARQIVYRRRGASPPAPAAAQQMTAEAYTQALSGIASERRALVQSHFGRRIPSQVEFENALVILGETGLASQYGVHGNFRQVLRTESMGGNAGQGHAAVNGVYDPVSGRILGFGNSLPNSISGRGRPFQLRVNMQTGQITVTRGGENPQLAHLNGLFISQQTGPRPPGPGGPGGGGPRRTTTPVSPDATVAPASARDISPGGGPVARSLTDATALATFARQLLLHERGIRTNQAVADQFSQLPEQVQQAVRRLTADSRFGMNAQGSDAMFTRFIGNRGRHGGAALVETARGDVIAAVGPEQQAAAQPVRRAVGAEMADDAVGTLHQTGSDDATGPVGMAREGPRAMADDARPSRPPPSRPPPSAQPAPAQADAGPATGGRATGPRSRPPAESQPGLTTVAAGAEARLQALTSIDVTSAETTSRPWSVLRPGERAAAMNDVVSIYEAAYGREGLRYHNARELLGRMDTIMVARDEHGRIVAFATFSETPRGTRLGLLGARRSSDLGRAAARGLLRQIAAEPGVYGNVSGRPAALAVAAGGPIVPIREVRRIMRTHRGMRGVGAAQRDLNKIRRVISDSQLEASPIVQDAMQRTGRNLEQLTFDDLVESAVRRREIPDTPEARANCFGLVQQMESAGGNAVPTLVIKLMVGRPTSTTPAATTVANATVIPRVQPTETRVAANPQDILGATINDVLNGVREQIPAIGPRDVSYRGTFERNGQRFVRFQHGGSEGRVIEINVPSETMDAPALSAYYQRELVRALRTPPPPPAQAVPAQATPAAAEVPFIRGMPEGARELTGRARSPPELLGRHLGINQLGIPQEWRFNGGVEHNGQTYVRFTRGRDAASEHVLVRQAPSSMDASARATYYQQQLAAGAVAPAQTTPAAPAEALIARRGVPESATELAGRARSPPELLGRGVTPKDINAALPEGYRFNGGVEVDGQTYVRFTRGRDDAAEHVLVRSRTDGTPAERLAYYGQHANSAAQTAAPAAPAESLIARVGVPESATELAGRARSPPELLGEGITPRDINNGMPEGYRFNGGVEIDGQTYVRFTRGRDADARHILVRRRAEGTAAERIAYYNQHANSAAQTATPATPAAAPAPAAAQPASAAPRARAPRLPPREAVRRTLTSEDTLALMNMERLLEGSVALSAEVSALLPGDANAPIRRIANALEQQALATGTIRPEYTDAITAIRSRSGAARAQEIASQARAIFEQRGGALAHAAAREIRLLVQDGVPFARASRAIESSLDVAYRYADPARTTADATDMMFMELIRTSRGANEPREVAALRVARDVAAHAARLRRPAASISAEEALGITVANMRASQAGRTITDADFMFGALVSRYAGRITAEPTIAPVADSFIHASRVLMQQVSPEQFPAMMQQLGRSAHAIMQRVPSSVLGDPAATAAIRGVFEFAGYMHMRGIADVAPLLSNRQGTGLLDLFPITDSSSYGQLGQAALLATEIAGDVAGLQLPQGVTFEDATTAAIRLAYEDVTRLSPDMREAYITALRDNFEVTDALLPRIMELNSRGADATGAGIPNARRRRLPMLTYALAAQEGNAAILNIDNSISARYLANDTNFRDFVRLLDNMRTADMSIEGTAWLGLVREQLEYTGLNAAERSARGITESLSDARRSFVTDRVRHLNAILELFNQGRIQPSDFNRATTALTGQLTREQFVSQVVRNYLEFTPGLQIPQQWALQNPELVLEFVALRMTFSMLQQGGRFPATRFPDFQGRRPDAYDVGMPILDQALRAHIEGRFHEFKFSPEFRAELNQLASAAGLDGNAIWNRWTTEATFDVTGPGGQRYTVHETGDFDAMFYAGVVERATACQSPRNAHPTVGGLLGAVELPWVRQVAVGVPGSPNTTYRRWLTLMRGDNGRPILMIQPEYSTPGAIPREVDAAIVAQLRQRYEPLGVEVRVMPGGSTTEYRDANGVLVNRGYSTFGSGRSPMFYLDSNMTSVTFQGRRAQNGLHTRTEGEPVAFPPDTSGGSPPPASP